MKGGEAERGLRAWSGLGARATPPVADDGAILEGFLAGRAEDVERVRGWVAGAVRHGHWNFEDPEGVTQDVVLKLLRVVRRGGYSGRSSLRTFVFSIARHTCVDAYRRERLRPAVEAGNAQGFTARASSDHPEDAAARREQQELLRYVFQRLPEECRVLWRWIHGAGLSAADVGQRLGISPESVRARSHRCLEKARDVGRAFLEAPAPDWKETGRG